MNEFEFFLSELITRVSSPDMAGLPGVKSDKFSVLYTFVCIQAGPSQARGLSLVTQQGILASDWSRQPTAPSLAPADTNWF